MLQNFGRGQAVPHLAYFTTLKSHPNLNFCWKHTVPSLSFISLHLKFIPNLNFDWHPYPASVYAEIYIHFDYLVLVFIFVSSVQALILQLKSCSNLDHSPKSRYTQN